MKTSLSGGYPCIKDSDIPQDRPVYIHHLVAIADGADPNDVYSDKYQVHHIDGNKWLNSDTNLELLTETEHRRLHMEGRTDGQPWTDRDQLVELRDEGLTQYEMADRLGCAQDTVSKWMNLFELDTSRIKREPWQDPDTMRDMHVERDMSMADMSDELDCSIGTIHNWLDRLGIR